MTEEKKAPKVLGDVKFLYPVDPISISHIHFIRFTQLGGEILMDVGIFDDQALIARITKTEPPEDASRPIKAYVTARFGMSPNTFAQVRGNIEELWKKMTDSGALKKLGLEKENGK